MLRKNISIRHCYRCFGFDHTKNYRTMDPKDRTRASNNMVHKFALFLLIWSCSTLAADILMATQGGTKSHKIPFWELARGLIARYVLLPKRIYYHNRVRGLLIRKVGGRDANIIEQHNLEYLY
uniref:Uncharacterized protein LOC108047812 isoform X2 n=1 Tax=Drosophila rhopaloa TaxID=1041015 RepID=A0A6P4FDQ3_DRORH